MNESHLYQPLEMIWCSWRIRFVVRSILWEIIDNKRVDVFVLVVYL